MQHMSGFNYSVSLEQSASAAGALCCSGVLHDHKRGLRESDLLPCKPRVRGHGMRCCTSLPTICIASLAIGKHGRARRQGVHSTHELLPNCQSVWLRQVEALLDRARGEPPAVAWLGQQLEGLGYSSWAYRVVNTASAPRARRLQHTADVWRLGVSYVRLGWVITG